MYVWVHLAIAAIAIIPNPHRVAELRRANAAAPRVRLPHCVLGKRLRTEIGEFLEESKLERAATVVELPVMFLSKEEQQLDEFGLLGKGERASTFAFERWAEHRSSSRYYRLLLGVLLGVTSRRVLPVLVALLSFSCLVCFYAQQCLTDPNLVTLQLPLTPFELTAPALGLLLVFRSDNAYARFKEGSELSWEISTSIRSAMRRLLAWTAAPHIPQSERNAAAELVTAPSKLAQPRLLRGAAEGYHRRAAATLFSPRGGLSCALSSQALAPAPGATGSAWKKITLCPPSCQLSARS